MGRPKKESVNDIVIKDNITKAEVMELKPKNYFLSDEKDVQFFSSGCTQLDCALSTNLLNDYKTVIIGGGWAERRAFNIIGDKATSKCIKNSYIITDKGFELIDNLGKDKKYGISDYKENLIVSKDKSDTTSHFWKEKVSNTIKIKTRHGFELEGTLEHPIMVWENNCTFVMKKLKDVKENDVCILAKGTNKYGKDYISLVIYENNNKHAANLKDITLPSIINEDIAILLGYFVADGNFINNTLLMSNSKEWFDENLNNVLKKFNLKRNKDGHICSGILVNTIYNIFNKPDKFTARYKYVPESILGSPKNVQIAFLQSLIDCNSSYTKGQLVYTTASELLGIQVQLMLLNLGIISSRKPIKNVYIGDKFYDHTSWNISIYAQDLLNYAKIIGSKKYNFSMVLSKERYKRCSDFDSLPFLKVRMKDDIDKVRKIVGWSKNGKTKEYSRRFPRFLLPGKLKITYNLLKDFITKFKSFEKFFDLKFYEDLSNSDYHFDYVTEIIQNNIETDVYDVHIPNTHLFWSNGFISHNTLLAEEACINFLKKQPNRRVVYIETESAFDVNYASKIGLDFNQKNIILEESIVTVEELCHKITEITGVLDEDDKGKDWKGLKLNTIPTLIIIDSVDGLSDAAELERAIDDKSFGANKAKQASSLFRRIIRKSSVSNITLGFISQIRDNIGVTFGNKETIACKHSLEFYCSQRLWLANLGQITKTIDGVELCIGTKVKARVAKNKVGRPFRICEFPMYVDMGINDLEANLTYLNSIEKLKEFTFDKYNIEVPQRLTVLMDRIINNENFQLVRNDLSEFSKKCWCAIELQFVPPYKKY